MQIKFFMFFMLLPFMVSGQLTYNDLFFIRDYKYSSLLHLKKEKSEEFYIAEYGTLFFQNSKTISNRYFYSAQEFLPEFGFYLFPSRVYCAIKKRFWQVDPRSQLFSPYSYLEGDPINFTDKDGEEKVPLILYEECQWFEGGMHYSTADLMTQVGKDAYYVPLTDFMNGSVGDLSDWNGNVFIDAHLEQKIGNEVQVETSPKPKWLRSNSEDVKMYKQFEPEEYFGITDARSLGENIGRLSLERGVKVHNVFMGGCQGKAAGARIGEGFKSAMPREMQRELWIHALKDGKYSVIAGKESTNEENVEGLSETRFHISDSEEGYYPYKKRVSFQRGKKQVIGLYKNNAQGLPEALPYADGKELNQMVRGAKVSKNIREHIDSFPVPY